MIHDAQVFLSGYVAMEPAFKTTSKGVSTVKLRIAYTARRFNKEIGEWEDCPTSFVNVHCWRGLADNVAKSLRKGEPVLVMGRMQVRPYDDPATGARRTVTEVDATSVGHDLTRGVANFLRTRRAAGGTAAEIAESEAAATQRPENGAGPDDLAAPAVADERSAGPARQGMPREPARDAVVDEQAVVDFARELNESLGADAEVDAGARARARR